MAQILPPRDEIIDRCNKAGPQDLLSYTPYGNSVLKLSDNIVVKFGNGVTKYEALSQDKAYQILDHGIVRVPQVYDFFEDNRGRGHLIMEFMEGEVQTSFTTISQLDALSRVLDHFATRKSEKPGSLGGGPSPALLFGESDPPIFNTVEEIERWYNIRHGVTNSTLSFQGSELVLCHLDLFPRNILWRSHQPPCVLDWASAGFYPRILEACSQLIRTRLEERDGVLKISISDDDINRVPLIIKAWENAQKYHFTRAEGRYVKEDIAALLAGYPGSLPSPPQSPILYKPPDPPY